MGERRPPRACQRCQGPIEDDRGYQARYCRPCAAARTRERDIARGIAARRIPTRRWCRECATPLPPHTKKGTPRWLCDLCRAEKSRAYQRRWQRRRYRRDPAKARRVRMDSYYATREAKGEERRAYQRAYYAKNAQKINERKKLLVLAKKEALERRVPRDQVLQEWGASP